MKIISKRRIFSLLFCLCLVAVTLSASVVAVGEDNSAVNFEAPVTIDIEYPIDNVAFRLYRVGDLSSDGANLTLTGEFAQFSEALPITDTDDFFSSYLSVLVDYVGLYELEAQTTGVTNDGHVYFETDVNGEELYPGVYLALCDKALEDGLYYICDPMMFCAPNRLSFGESWTYDIKVNGKYVTVPEEKEPTWIQVTKRWEDEGYEASRPESISVALVCDGVLYEEVKLSEENRWTYTWEDLDSTCSWSVTEINVPQGYTLQKDTTYVNQHILTNTKETPPPPATPPDQPNTGVLWWPVPVLIVIGLSLFIIGMLKQRREEV